MQLNSGLIMSLTVKIAFMTLHLASAVGKYEGLALKVPNAHGEYFYIFQFKSVD